MGFTSPAEPGTAGAGSEDEAAADEELDAGTLAGSEAAAEEAETIGAAGTDTAAAEDDEAEAAADEATTCCWSFNTKWNEQRRTHTTKKSEHLFALTAEL